ncbi:hypothetical protein ACK3F5_18725 [Photorhabdus asymbiotica UENP]
MTGVRESSQQSSNLKDEGYKNDVLFPVYSLRFLKSTFILN